MNDHSDRARRSGERSLDPKALQEQLKLAEPFLPPPGTPARARAETIARPDHTRGQPAGRR